MLRGAHSSGAVGKRRGQSLIHGLTLVVEISEHVCGNWFARRLARVLAARIDEHTVAPQSIVEVRTGRSTGGPDAPDQLTLLDSCPGANAGRKRRQVKVKALESRPMAKVDLSSAAARPCSRHHDAAGDRNNGSSGRRGVVHTQVRTHGVMDGMHAPAREP